MEPIVIGLVLMALFSWRAIDLVRPKQRTRTQVHMPPTAVEQALADALIWRYEELSREHTRRVLQWEIDSIFEEPTLLERNEHEAQLVRIRDHMKNIEGELTLRGRVAPPCN